MVAGWQGGTEARVKRRTLEACHATVSRGWSPEVGLCYRKQAVLYLDDKFIWNKRLHQRVLSVSKEAIYVLVLPTVITTHDQEDPDAHGRFSLVGCTRDQQCNAGWCEALFLYWRVHRDGCITCSQPPQTPTPIYIWDVRCIRIFKRSDCGMDYLLCM